MELTQEYLKSILHYSIITGEFYRLKATSSRAKVGQMAGTLHSSGYRKIMVNGKLYYAHRLAWFYCTGEWPADDIDHKTSVKDANYWLNIREATGSQNLCNTDVYSNNTSGFKGVGWCKARNKWQARIRLNNKSKSLGYFENIEDAYAERLKAESALHGRFARSTIDKSIAERKA